MSNPHLMKTIRIVALLVLAFALLMPFDSVAYAQEGDPPPPATETEDPQQESEEPSAEEPEDDPGDEAEPEAEPEESAPEPVEEPAPTEEPVSEEAAPEPTDEVEEPAEEAAPAEDQETGDQETEEQAAEESDAEETDLGEAAAVSDAVVAMNEGDIMLVDEDGEPLPMGSQEAAEALTAPDPMFCPEGVAYGGAGCSAAYTTFAEAIAAAIAAGGNGTIYVEAGDYTEDVTVDGSGWTTTPGSFTIQSLGDSSDTTITGNVIVTNMNDFMLEGFTIMGGLVFDSNTGTLTVSDVNVTNTGGTGMTVTNQTGDVEVSDSQFNDNAGSGMDVQATGTVTVRNVQANNNQDGDGASIVAGGYVDISDSTFNYNTNSNPGDYVGNGLFVGSDSTSITLNNVVAMYNEESGAVLWFSTADTANEILIQNSSFKYNGEFGVWAQPESGTVIFDCVNLAGNALGAKMVPVGESVVWVACPCDDDKKGDDDEYKIKVPVSSETSTIVNPGNGTLITFPPVDIIDEDEDAWGKVLPLTEDDLPGELPLGDIFKAGVDVQLINALLPPGSFLTVDFFVPGYLWDEDFAVLFWDADTGEWVELPFTMEPHPRIPGGRITVEWPETGVFALVMR